MKPERFDTALLIILYLDAGLIVAFQVLGLDRAVSLLFTLTFPLTLLLWLRTVREKLRLEDLLILLTGAVSLAALLLDGLTSGGIRLTGLKKWVMFLMTLLYFQTAARLTPDVGTCRLLRRLADLLTVFLLAIYVLDRQRLYQMNGIPTDYLTFGFSNPNLAGLFLTCLYMLQLGQMKGKLWPVHAVFALILAWFVIRTQSRNCILVLALYALLRLLHRDKPLTLSRPAAHLTAWFPAIFAVGYLLLVDSSRIQALFRFFTGEGKELGSRVEIWTWAVQNIAAAPLTGVYNGICATQLHNSHLDIAASYGIPVLILTCSLLARHLRRPVSAGFVCCLLLGMGESALFSGGLGIYLFAGAFLLLREGEYEAE